MADGTALARWAEGNHPRWAVVWGAYNREFTAWALWSRQSLVVTAPDTQSLSIAIRRAEQRSIELLPRTNAGWRSRPPTGPPPHEPHGPEAEGQAPPEPPEEDEPPGHDAPGPWLVPARPKVVAAVHTEGVRVWRCQQPAAGVPPEGEVKEHADDRAG